MSGDEGLHEEHEEHVNHEAWVIPYADLLTLLMAMFIALFAMSTVDLEKFKALSVGFNEALGGGELATGVFSGQKGDSALDNRGNGPYSTPAIASGGAAGALDNPPDATAIERLLEHKVALEVAKSAERESLEAVKQHIESAAEAKGLVGDLGLRLEERGLVVTVVTDQVLFDSGSALVRPEGQALLAVVGEALKSVDNPVLVEGHTDDVPISTAVYPSNWQLSSGRAGAVVEFFEAIGLDRARLQSIGFADTRPIGDNATAEGRATNRRVEIVVQSKVVEQVLEDAGVTADPVVGIDPVDEGIETVDPIVPDLRGEL